MSTTIVDRDATGALPVADPYAAAIAEIQGATAAVADLPAWTLTEDTAVASLGALLQIRASVAELTARVLASVVSREVPRLAGASSPRSWLSGTYGLSPADATRLLSESTVHEGERTDRRCGPTRQAWADGSLPAERAALVAATVTSLNDAIPATATDALQADLLAQSPALTWPQFQTMCRHAISVIDPDGADATLEAQLLAEEDRARQLTQLRYRRVGDGTTRGSFRLPDAAADMLRAALDAATSPRHRAHEPGNGARARLDDGSLTYDEPPLSHPQRLGHAFVELIEHLPIGELPRHGVANASIVVTCTLDQLRTGCGEATLASGTAMSTREVRRLACNAGVLPAVLDSASAVLDLGRQRRLFTRHQRLALAIRDKGCIWPGCDRPPSWTEAHHVTAWSDGGPTDLANGCLVCPYHHHLAHKGEWAIQIGADGIPAVIPPQRLDPDRQPRRHERLMHRARC